MSLSKDERIQFLTEVGDVLTDLLATSSLDERPNMQNRVIGASGRIDRLLYDSKEGTDPFALGYQGTIPDLVRPEFNKAGRVHDWRNHVPDNIIAAWFGLSDQARAVAFILAESEADREEWE